MISCWKSGVGGKKSSMMDQYSEWLHTYKHTNQNIVEING